MTNPVPKVGDKIRASVEGTVERVVPPGGTGLRPAPGRLSLRKSDGRVSFYNFGPGCLTELEILEPKYADEGIYRDQDGDIFQYNANDNSWLEFGSDMHWYFEYPSKPLTRIDA